MTLMKLVFAGVLVSFFLLMYGALALVIVVQVYDIVKERLNG